MKHPLSILVAAVILSAGCSAPQSEWHPVTAPDGRQWQPMRVERIANLHVPRGGHNTIVAGGEIVVIGGLTDGYKLMESAEYYSGGSWHTVPMLYPHVNGFLTPLPDGRILLGGGSQEDFGIGQSWGMEIYDPVAHTFTPVGIMSEKRAQCNALTLPDGSVLIAGNWYAPDSYETWRPDGGSQPGEALTPGWCRPYLFQASPNDVIAFGPIDTRGDSNAGLVCRLGSGTQHVQMLDDWLFFINEYYTPEDLRIADYTYLVPAQNKVTGEGAIFKVASGEFSFLELKEPLPKEGPGGNLIGWTMLEVDRTASTIWLQGLDNVGRLCFAKIGYESTFDGGKASTELYYAEIPGGFPSNCARLLPDGGMIMAGGNAWNGDGAPVINDYFKTYSSAYILHTEQQKAEVPPWAIVAAILAVGIVVLLILLLRRKPREQPVPEEEGRDPNNLMDQISDLIQKKELWRRKDLRISDLASEMATNKTYVSLLINNISGSSFTNIVNGYRIRHAQELMREHPDMLLDDVAADSGFSSYTSFYRNFKAVTGLTPQEWKQSR